MTWLNTLLNHLLPHHPPDRAAEIDTVLRETARVQLSIATAADGIKDAATEHRAKVDAVRAKIVERTAVHEQRKRKGQTSETLSLVEEMLTRPRLGGNPKDRGSADL